MSILKYLKSLFNGDAKSTTKGNYSIFVDGVPTAPRANGGTIAFNYMNLSKIFTNGSIGWVTEERDSTRKFSAGGFESSDASLQNGTSYIDLVSPFYASNYADTAFEFTFIGNSTTNTECKLDINIYQSDNDMSNATHIYTQTAYVVSSSTEPVALTIARGDLLSAFAKRRITIQLEFYSKSNKSIKLISGSCNYI